MFVLDQTPATGFALCWRPTRTGKAFFLWHGPFINADQNFCVCVSYSLELSSAVSFAIPFRTSRNTKLSRKQHYFTKQYEIFKNVIATSLVSWNSTFFMKFKCFILGFRDVVLSHLNPGYILTSYLICILILPPKPSKWICPFILADFFF
jgi:hypothetical protein